MGGFNLLEILGVIGVYSLTNPYLQLVVRKIVFVHLVVRGWKKVGNFESKKDEFRLGYVKLGLNGPS